MRKAAIAAGAGAAALILLAISRSAEGKVASRKVAGSKLVPFTQEKVFWRYNKKKKRDEYRVQVAESLQELAAKASRRLNRPVAMDDFLLASLVASEAGNQPAVAKTAIAHAALTMADKLGVSVRTLLIPPKQGGKLGSQHGRYASTARPPTTADLEIAESVRRGEVPNPTPRAIQWDSPLAQNKLTNEEAFGYNLDADQLRTRRENENKVAIYIPGVDPMELRLWRPAA